MRKKKYKFRKKERIVPYNGEVYSQRYIYYTEDGSIDIVSPFPIDSVNLDFLIISDSLILDFIDGSRFYKDYNIDFFNRLKNGLVTDKEVVVDTNSTSYYVLPISSNYNNMITVEHFNDRWQLKIKEGTELTEKCFQFYLCLKSNPNFLIRELKFTEETNYVDKFQDEIEKNLLNVLLITKTTASSYAVKESSE